MNGIQGPVTAKESSGGKRLKEPQPRVRRTRQSRGKKRRQVSAAIRWRRLTWVERLILLLPAVAAVIIAGIVLFLNRDLMRYTLKEKPCQYYGGNVYRMAEGTILCRTAEDKTIAELSGQNQELSSLPIYYEDQQVVVLPQNMVYYAPRTGTVQRMDYFTELELQSASNGVIARRDDREVRLSPGFLYDGKDFYLFLEPIVVSFNGYSIVLPAMSWVEAVYTGDIMVFNYNGKEFFMEPPVGSADAQIETGDYSISLLGDSIVDDKGDRMLLFTRPELLDSIFH